MFVGVDIGGTKIEAIVFDGKKIVAEEKLETEKKGNEFIGEIVSIIEKISKGYKIWGIGLGIPGVMDREKGIIIKMPNIPHVKNVNIKKIIEKKFNVPVRIEKDANCMALAEFFFGYGKGKENIVAITIGTGLGGGIIIHKKIYLGRGSAAEVGHLNIEPEGLRCSCGSRGCLEEYVSGRGIIRIAKELGVEGTPREIEDKARGGDKKAQEAYRKMGFYLGSGISDIIKVLDPEIITISGSMAHAADLFIEETKKQVKERVFFKHCEIKISKLKSAPAIGAASLFLQ